MASLRVPALGQADAEALVVLVDELNEQAGDPTDAFTLEVYRRDWFDAHRAPFGVPLAALDGRAVGDAVPSPDYGSGWATPGSLSNDLDVRARARPSMQIGAGIPPATTRRQSAVPTQ